MPSGRRPYDPYTRYYNVISVVTREMVCIALTMMALHDQEVKADVLNAYVMAPNCEKI